MAERPTLLPHQHAQARLSTGAGGIGMSSPEARGMSASVEILVATLLADLAVWGRMCGGTYQVQNW